MPSSEFHVIGPWSEVKLEILRKYAGPYSRIVAGKGFYHLYIDGFAGRGSYISRETGDVVPGSPLNALSTRPPFKEYHLIDLDAGKVEQLRAHVGPRPDVHIHSGDCNEVLLSKVFPLAKRSDFRRALCLLDPYNIDVSWDVVRTAGQMESVEIFLNFMVMDMNMNVLLTKPENADPSDVVRMNRFWGDESWRDVVYEPNPQSNLWGDAEIVKVQGANDKIAEAYRQRLLQVAGFKYAPEPLPFRNSLDRTVYYLFFASPKAVAKNIVQDIFDKYRNRKWS